MGREEDRAEKKKKRRKKKEKEKKSRPSRVLAVSSMGLQRDQIELGAGSNPVFNVKCI